jgi:hypothetical protein
MKHPETMCTILSVLVLLLFVVGCEEKTDDASNPDDSAGQSGTVDEAAPVQDEDNPATEPDTSELPFQQVSLHYMFDHEETVVIRSQEQWDDYLSQDLVLGGSFSPSDDLTDPNCSFAENMLVAHSFGPVQADFAFQSVSVTAVTVDAGRIIVNVSVDVRDPPSGGFTMPAFTYEGSGVCIPQSELPVEVVVSYY